VSEPTYATVATFRMDMSREDEQRHALREFIVAGVRRHPGFLSGYWMLDRDAEESVVVLTYSSRKSAEALRKNVEGNAANQAASGVALLHIRLVEVTASAQPL
jgi:quinol monooxygenase YgiN